MKKEDVKLFEALSLIKEQLPSSMLQYVGGALRDALVTGKRSELLTEKEALSLSDMVEVYFMGGSYNEVTEEQNEKEQHFSECGDITPEKYYNVFLKPAMDIISEEYSELIGQLFVKYICTGEHPAEDALSEDEKLLWNVFMAMVEIHFNPKFAEFFAEDKP